MTDERKGGIALIASQASILVTMAFHPMPGEHAILRGIATHTLAIFATPIAIFGASILSQRLKTRLAFSYLLVATIIGILAPIMSGFVATSSLQVPPEVMKLAWILNQTCTRIWVTGNAIAFLLWSYASWRENLLPRQLAVYGFVSGGAVLAFVFSGLPFDVHHTGIVALVQAIFFVFAGVVLIRSSAAPAQPAPFPA